MIRPILVTFVFALLVAGVVQAEPAGYAVVDTQEVLEKSKLGSQSIAELEALSEKYKTDSAPLSAEVESLSAKVDKLKGDGAPTEELVEAQAALEQKNIEFKRKKEDFQIKFTAERDKLLQVLEKKASAAILAVAKDSGHSVVLRKENTAILYKDPEAEPADLTTQVIQKMDELP